MTKYKEIPEEKNRVSKLPTKPKYSWTSFLESFKNIHEYAVGRNAKDDLPVISFTFKSRIQLKVFLYWLQILGMMDTYASAVYFHDVLPEQLAGTKELPKKKDTEDA